MNLTLIQENAEPEEEGTNIQLSMGILHLMVMQTKIVIGITQIDENATCKRIET